MYFFLISVVKGGKNEIKKENDLRQTNLLDFWLKNITTTSNETCQSCLNRCGHSCFDLCHAFHNCSEDPQIKYRSNTNLTTLVLLIRGLLNDTNVGRGGGNNVDDDDDDDDFESRYRCSIGDDAVVDGETGAEFREDVIDDDKRDDYIPLEDRHCTKQICRRRFFGVVRPKQIEQVRETCATASNKYCCYRAFQSFLPMLSSSSSLHSIIPMCIMYMYSNSWLMTLIFNWY